MSENSAPDVRVEKVQWKESRDRAAVIELLDLYAQHPMGAGAPLSDEVRGRVVEGLRSHPTCEVFLAWIDATPVALVVAFGGYSTFQAAPLLNLHDVFVREGYRGQRIGQRLLEAVRHQALLEGYCKLTLEVRDDNFAAQRAYRNFGFRPLTPGVDAHRFWTLALQEGATNVNSDRTADAAAGRSSN